MTTAQPTGNQLVYRQLCLAVMTLFLLSGVALAQTDWVKHPDGPVLEPGPAGAWDSAEVWIGAVLLEGDQYLMWYSGTNGTTMHIGLATSEDGVNWAKHAGNPVLEAGEHGEWDDGCLWGPDVIFNGSTYEMWYGGMREWLGFSQVGYATSPDGTEWTRHPDSPVMTPTPGTWEEYAVWPRTVIFDGERYQMWYSGALGSPPSPESWDIGYAESADGVNWVKHPTPVLSGRGDIAWDNWLAWSPDVHFDGEVYRMWYTGNDGFGGYGIGYATSLNGIHWAKLVGNPVLELGGPGAWDSLAVQNGRVILGAETAHMWYTGFSTEDFVAVGYASGPVDQFPAPALQLNDGRFLVEVMWWDEQANIGDGMPMQLTRDSGCFWFFDEDNVEILVKVLDACAISNRYWVFAAGLTDLGLTIKVTDKETDEVWFHTNTLGEAFQTVLDNQGFATCP